MTKRAEVTVGRYTYELHVAENGKALTLQKNYCGVEVAVMFFPLDAAQLVGVTMAHVATEELSETFAAGE